MATFTRLVLPPPVRTWTGSTWNRPTPTIYRRLVTPVPLRRWDGTAWVALYTPH